MSSPPEDFWQRAKAALAVAEHDLPLDSDAAASRAYYAAFYAVSALFAVTGRTFSKHTAIEAAVHRDLVNTGTWPASLGKGFSRLYQLRGRGDYGGGRHVSPPEAEESIRLAREIIQAVHKSNPALFPS